ncbi:MAG TPA: hypothetical protein VH414_05055 [Lichenihabitans sp.]|jgi:hypothetical protein|nr:hypothetical protein [Lichenihabitans sp.]
MSRFVGLLREAYGLIVDDATLAAAILAWIAVVWLLDRGGALAPAWGGIVLFVGLALIVIENAVRRARSG